MLLPENSCRKDTRMKKTCFCRMKSKQKQDYKPFQWNSKSIRTALY